MASGASGHRNEAVRTLFNRLMGETVVDHIMQDDAAPRMDGIIQLHLSAQRRDRKRHLPFRTGCDVFLQAVIRFMYNLVDRIRRCQTIWVVAVMRSKFFSNLM